MISEFNIGLCMAGAVSAGAYTAIQNPIKHVATINDIHLEKSWFIGDLTKSI